MIRKFLYCVSTIATKVNVLSKVNFSWLRCQGFQRLLLANVKQAKEQSQFPIFDAYKKVIDHRKNSQNRALTKNFEEIDSNYCIDNGYWYTEQVQEFKPIFYFIQNELQSRKLNLLTIFKYGPIEFFVNSFVSISVETHILRGFTVKGSYTTLYQNPFLIRMKILKFVKICELIETHLEALILINVKTLS